MSADSGIVWRFATRRRQRYIVCADATCRRYATEGRSVMIERRDQPQWQWGEVAIPFCRRHGAVQGGERVRDFALGAETFRQLCEHPPWEPLSR